MHACMHVFGVGVGRAVLHSAVQLERVKCKVHILPCFGLIARRRRQPPRHQSI